MNYDKEVLNKILTSSDVIESINHNIDYILDIIPEIKFMIGFPHNHVAHYLDVWNHTLCALSNSENDLTIRIVLLFHDIGKPFSYQDSETTNTRHFKGHPAMSVAMTWGILKRLGYNTKEIELYTDLIKIHDNTINVGSINKENINFYKLLIKIQYADLMAHSYEYRTGKLIKHKEISDKINSLVL